MNDLRYAVVQEGHAVFGVGHTYDEALVDAAKWIEPENGRQGDMTPDEVEALCVAQPMDGEFHVISIDDEPEDFNYYLRVSQSFVKRNGRWYEN